tara:strand:- start:1551 stop:3629 length:2079 start_codon:yes stop_codon:yes gene_type:complete
MPLTQFQNLDFEDIKAQIKDYLRANSNFTDFDFEGSNMSVLIDTLAYNSYITAYNSNMVANEVFIDTATLRENVAALARNVGYTPRSKKSSKAIVSFFVDTSSYATQPLTLTLKAGIVAVSNSFASTNYSFAIMNDVTVPVVDNIAEFNDVDIFEGSYLKKTFTYRETGEGVPIEKFILPNANIDTSTIKVTVSPNSSATNLKTIYTLTDNIIDVTNTSLIFLLQEVADEKYEVIFGDGKFGKKLEDSNYISVNYISTNGKDANGVNSFTFTGNIEDNSGVTVTEGISDLTTINAAENGDDIESVSSIKKYAPLVYSAQNRAVTADDYKAIIANIYSNTESVSVYGGEDTSPPQYGKVFISIKPKNGKYLSQIEKIELKNKLKRYTVAGILPNIIDLKYLYVEMDSSVYYNANTTNSVNALKTAITKTLNTYARASEINTFGARFKFSKAIRLIDQTDSAITSNITRIAMRRDLRPALSDLATYEFCYGNAFNVNSLNGFNIKSSGFSVSGISGTVYISDIPNPDRKTGRLILFKLLSSNQVAIIRNNIGTIEYTKGEILINAIIINSTVLSTDQPIIQISGTPKSYDVIGLQDLYLQLDTSNSLVTMVSDTISSGADISGSNYVVSSSFPNGRDDRESPLVRGIPQYATVTGTEATNVQEVDTSYATTYTTSTSFNSVEVTGNTSSGGYSY